MDRTNPQEIAEAIAKLGTWETAAANNFALIPLGSKEPYLVSVAAKTPPPVKARILFFRGWRPFHNFVIARQDRDFGVAVSPAELDHLEAVFTEDGEVQLISFRAGCVPVPPDHDERIVMARLLYETYGLMMRFENEVTLGMKYADERALFARIEGKDGKWQDGPHSVPETPPQFVERVELKKDLVSHASDVPFAAGTVWELDFFRLPGQVESPNDRPKTLYLFAAVDAVTGERRIWDLLTVNGEKGLLNAWEKFAPRVLDAVIAGGFVPGEIRVRSMRMVRFLRPLGMHLPFKLVVNSKLAVIDAEVSKAVKEKKL